MKIRFLLVGLLAMITSACADHEWEPATEPTEPGLTRTVRLRTLEEALTIADNWFTQMERNTRSVDRKVKSVDYVKSAYRTRSDDHDTLMYLVNYENNQGFALLGCPETSKDIYAISEEGSLDMSDTVYNKPLAMFIASARVDAKISTLASTNISGRSILPINPPIGKIQ